MRISMEADAANEAAASCSTRGASAHLTAVDLRGLTKTPPRSRDNVTQPSLESRMEIPSISAAAGHKEAGALGSRMDSPSISAAPMHKACADEVTQPTESQPSLESRMEIPSISAASGHKGAGALGSRMDSPSISAAPKHKACTGVPHGKSIHQRGIPADEVEITGLLGRPGSLQQAHTTQTKNIRARASRGGDKEAPASAGPLGILAVAGT